MEYCRIPSIIRGLSSATYRQEIFWNKCILSAQFIFMWILWNLSNGIVRFTKILTFKSSIILDTKNEPRKVKIVLYIRFPVLSHAWPGASSSWKWDYTIVVRLCAQLTDSCCHPCLLMRRLFMISLKYTYLIFFFIKGYNTSNYTSVSKFRSLR